MAFQVAFERKHRVIRATASGVVVPQDLIDLDLTLVAFLGRQAPEEAASVRGLYDFSAVTAIAVSQLRTEERGSRPAILRGQRVWVRSPTLECGLVDRFVQSQRLAGHNSLAVVDTLAEAHALLGLRSPRFEAIA